MFCLSDGSRLLFRLWRISSIGFFETCRKWRDLLSEAFIDLCGELVVQFARDSFITRSPLKISSGVCYDESNGEMTSLLWVRYSGCLFSSYSWQIWVSGVSGTIFSLGRGVYFYEKGGWITWVTGFTFRIMKFKAVPNFLFYSVCWAISSRFYLRIAFELSSSLFSDVSLSIFFTSCNCCLDILFA